VKVVNERKEKEKRRASACELAKDGKIELVLVLYCLTIWFYFSLKRSCSEL
jgi:hypothetical protein